MEVGIPVWPGDRFQIVVPVSELCLDTPAFPEAVTYSDVIDRRTQVELDPGAVSVEGPVCSQVHAQAEVQIPGGAKRRGREQRLADQSSESEKQGAHEGEHGSVWKCSPLYPQALVRVHPPPRDNPYGRRGAEMLVSDL